VEEIIRNVNDDDVDGDDDNVDVDDDDIDVDDDDDVDDLVALVVGTITKCK